MVPNEDRDEEECDDEEHLAKLQHHIEVCIDTEAKHEEWIFNKLILVTRQVQAHILHERLSERMPKVRLFHLVQAPFELWHNMVRFGFIAQWVHVLDGHEHLVDLLLSQFVRLFPLSYLERYVVASGVVT